MVNKLYRGVVLDYDEINKIQYGDSDIVMHYEPIIDKSGEKTVLDGNEYGIYMSDNKTMVDDAYGKPHRFGKPLENGAYGNPAEHNRISTPVIAVVYEIEADKVSNLRKPRITNVLKGHYNNGFEGEEWICDKIPSNSYSINRLMVGYDTLHDSELIDLTNKNKKEICFELNSILDLRKNDLALFCEYINHLPQNKRNMFSSSDLELYKNLFIKLRIQNIDLDNFNINNELDKINYLLAFDFKQNGFNTEIQNFLIRIKRYLFKDNKRTVESFIDEKINILKIRRNEAKQFGKLNLIEFNNRRIEAFENLKRTLALKINQNCRDSQPVEITQN